MRTAAALYGLHIDAFLEGVASEAPKAEDFGLSPAQAREVRRQQYLIKIVDARAKKAKVA